MKLRRLGKTHLMVSEIGFGGWAIGGKDWGITNDFVSRDALNEAYGWGITFYDTAPSYGRSEALIGEAFRNCRDKVVICTKTVDGNIDQSLRHFGYIDVLLVHGVPVTPQLVDTLTQHGEHGDVRVWGVSVKSPFDAVQAFLAGAQVIEANFSMMDRRALDVGLENFIARTPLNFGFLSGTITRDTVFPEGHHLNNWPREKIEQWIDQAKECLGNTEAGSPSVHKALKWVLSHPVSTAIVGMTTPEQVKENTWTPEPSDEPCWNPPLRWDEDIFRPLSRGWKSP